MGLTPKQKELLDFITQFTEERGYAPSQMEIARAFGFKSLGTVQNYLVRLEREGVLTKPWNARRGMQVVASSRSQATALSSAETPESRRRNGGFKSEATATTVPLPLAGRVAAGRPIEAIDQAETVDIPTALLHGGAARTRQHFVLRVVGDSMRDDGILDGDLVVIHKQERAENGQTVVALLKGTEATIKRYYRKADRVELHPANPAFKPIVISSLVETPEFRIEGVLTGVVRKL